MGRISDKIQTLKAKYKIVRTCRTEVNAALKNIQKVYDTAQWVKVPDNEKACIRYYQNTVMPLVARGCMHIPLYHECNSFNEHKICPIGLTEKCKWYGPNKVYVTAKNNLDKARKDFWNCFLGR